MHGKNIIAYFASSNNNKQVIIMTKVIDLSKISLGLEDEQEKVLKPIEFSLYLCRDNRIGVSCAIPKIYKYIELICKSYSEDGLDLMFAYDDKDERKYGYLYLGKFNDGIV